MKKLFFLALIYALNSFSCDELIQRFEDDCKLQDRTNILRNNFRQAGIDYKKISGPKALRFVDRKSWEIFIASGGTDPSQIYEPAPETWNSWDMGLEQASRSHIDLIKDPLTLEFIQNLHRVSMSERAFYSPGAFYLKGARPGKIRTHWFIRPPEFWFKCEDKYSIKVKKLLLDYDLKDKNGRPMISSSISQCADGLSIKGHVTYLSSHKVEEEIRRWLQHFNIWIVDYLNGVTKISPIKAAADFQRWYVSIHPFGDGNGRTSRYLQDLLLDFVGIAPPLSADLSDDQTRFSLP